MSVGSDLKRFNFHDYVARTAEYALQIDPHNPAAVNRFFTTDYLKMFLEDLLAGRLSPSLYSEEEVQIEDVTQSQKNKKNQEGDGKVYSTSIVGKNFNMR